MLTGPRWIDKKLMQPYNNLATTQNTQEIMLQPTRKPITSQGPSNTLATTQNT